MPTLRLFGGNENRRELVTTAWSPKKISPASGVSNPATIRKVVVLPHPLGPSKVTISPSYTSRERFCRAALELPGYVFHKPRRLTAILAGVGEPSRLLTEIASAEPICSIAAFSYTKLAAVAIAREHLALGGERRSPDG